MAGAAQARVVGSRAPVRGTQSFVGVMTEVWRRPSLTGLEVLWRWAVGAPILALAAWRVEIAAATVHVDTAALGAMTVFKPVAAFEAMHAAVAAVLPAAKPVVVWLLPLAAVLWLVAAALGRTAVLKRFDKTLRARRLTLLVLSVMRAALLTGAWALWVWVVLKAGAIAITGPAASGGEPDVVLYSAMLICGSLFVYVLWGLMSWPFQLAPLLAMQKNLGPLGSLHAALRSTAVRGKLIEVNLVMSIVKIGVLVLGMVFSACPLPFANVESQTFLTCWWTGVILAYLVALDYFHVVHTVAHLWLWRAYDFPASERRANLLTGIEPLQSRCALGFLRITAMSFALYGLGTLILIIGVLYICHLVHLPTHWTIALAILLFGAGLMGAVSSTRQRDKSE